MNFIAIAIACVVLAAGSYVSHSQATENENVSVETQEVLSETSTEVDEGETSVSVSIQNNEEVVTQSPTPTSTPSSSPTVTTAPSSSLSGYIYGGSEVLSQSDNKLSLRSTADTDAITNWYKEKIKGEGMNIKTFVTTKANDKILNKLVGAENNREIFVEIKKDPGDTATSISVSMTN